MLLVLVQEEQVQEQVLVQQLCRSLTRSWKLLPQPPKQCRRHPFCVVKRPMSTLLLRAPRLG